MTSRNQQPDSTSTETVQECAYTSREGTNGRISTTFGNFLIEASMKTSSKNSSDVHEVSAKLEEEHFAFALSNIDFPALERSDLELALLRRSNCCTLAIYADAKPIVDAERLPERNFRVSTPCCTADIDLVLLSTIESSQTQPVNLKDSKRKRKKAKKGIRECLGSSLFAATPLRDLLACLNECCERDRRSITAIENELSALSR